LDAVLTLGLCLAGVAALPAAVHIGFRAPRIRETGSPADQGLDFEAVRIPTVRGRTLFGWLLPAPDSKRTVVILHGWGSNAELMLPIAGPLRRAGLNVLLCDARCHGSSDADTFASLPRFAEDLGKSVEWLRRHHPRRAGRVAVLGHSVGAGAALFLASRGSDLSAVISIAAFAHPAEVTERYLRRLRLPRPVVGLVIRYVEWLIGYRFETIAPVNTLRHIRCPVLLVHGSHDRAVPIEDARRIEANRGAARVRLVEIPGAGHGSTEQIERYAPRLLAFLDESW
jgi:pimeloyl-ACP methyl ester carboxylesterase